MRILAVETSCDETAIAIAEFLGPKQNPSVRALSHIVSSQAKLHAKFGGVVPNLARREHQKNLAPILLHALNQAGAHKSKVNPRFNRGQNPKVQVKIQTDIDAILARESELLRQFKKYILPIKPPPVDAIAVTYGPGLAPALWVGVNFAKALAYLWGKPLIPVNHMAGHFFSASRLESGRGKKVTGYRLPVIKFPTVALLVSGGHTELILIKKPWKFRVIGETLDDAAGEAFDKVARIMGFPYPGGPAISRLAAKGDAKKYPLPSPMLYSKDYNFSFSGLKTAVFYLIRDLSPYETRSHRNDIAASFQSAAIDVLVKKTVRAAKEYKAKTILLGGGVAANKKLRRDLAAALKRELPNSKLQVPRSDLCGDNALMIATAAYFTGKKTAWRNVQADANVTIGKTL